MNIGRFFHGVVEFDDLIYAFGGKGLDSAE